MVHTRASITGLHLGLINRHNMKGILGNFVESLQLTWEIRKIREVFF